MPSKTKKCVRNDEKLNSTLPCNSRKVEYKFFIEVIECRYARVLGRQHVAASGIGESGEIFGARQLCLK